MRLRIKSLANCTKTETFDLITAKMETDENKVHICAACFKMFDSEELLVEHCCVDKKPYVCQVCHSVFEEETEFHEHQMTHNQDTVTLPESGEKCEKRFHCDKCKKKFSSISDFEKHNHCIQCKVCKKTFSKKYGSHENSHG